MIPPSRSIKSISSENSVSIASGKISILDPNKPVLFMHYCLVGLIGITGLINGFFFIENSKSFHLMLFVVSLIFLLVFLVRELMFRTYEDEIKLLKVSKVTIRKLPGGKENVNLVIHLQKRKRIVFISEARAREIKTILHELHY